MRRIWLACLLLVVSVSAAHGRSLYWQSLDVQARLDAQGALHVVERHAMVFDGDWNGGERRFQLRRWNSLALESVSKIDPDSGARTALTQGDLRRINTYELMRGEVLRWRSRLPTDPPFRNTLLVYEITYTLRGVLIREGDEYLLNHDLAFPNRDGPIARFDATFEMDPAWQGAEVPRTFHRERLPPGQSQFVTGRLRYTGVEVPAAVASPRAVATQPAVLSPRAVALTPPPEPSPAWLRFALFLLVSVFAGVGAIRLIARERDIGRFEPLLPLDRVDDAWLGTNVLGLRPEVVGAAWDRKTGAAEVAALIARLTLEGKLTSEVREAQTWGSKHEVLHLTLSCEREELGTYERELIDKLFFDGRTQTDTETVREHYKQQGFSPASVITRGVEQRLPGAFRAKLKLPPWKAWLTAGSLALGAVLAALGWERSDDAAGAGIAMAIGMLVLFGVGAISAASYRKHVDRTQRRLAWGLIAPSLMWLVMASMLLGQPLTLGVLAAIGFASVCFAFLHSLLNQLHSREPPDVMTARRSLFVAREYFKRELASERPRLKDEWFPYLVALDLGPNMTRWFEAFGGMANAADPRDTVDRPSPRSHPGLRSGAWTGGGGAFGGGGASGSWAAAATAVAAGVAIPSSDDSGGGGGGSSSSRGGGGSSRSGGGGGGGW